jgi:hypothetical protein
MSIRCTYCGYDNPDGSTSCCKCNQPLNINQEKYSSQIDEDVNEFNPKKTVRETDFGQFEKEIDSPQKILVCPKCGYPVSMNMVFCTNCGAKIQEDGIMNKTQLEKNEYNDKVNHIVNKDTRIGRMTVRPNHKHNLCSLKLILDEDEKIEVKKLVYSGNNIIINRDNTEPDNYTITSKEQAVLSHDGSDWYIEDKSELQSTFIHISGRIKLKNGDIIMLGDRCFRFES